MSVLWIHNCDLIFFLSLESSSNNLYDLDLISNEILEHFMQRIHHQQQRQDGFQGLFQLHIPPPQSSYILSIYVDRCLLSHRPVSHNTTIHSAWVCSCNMTALIFLTFRDLILAPKIRSSSGTVWLLNIYRTERPANLLKNSMSVALFSFGCLAIESNYRSLDPCVILVNKLRPFHCSVYRSVMTLRVKRPLAVSLLRRYMAAACRDVDVVWTLFIIVFFSPGHWLPLLIPGYLQVRVSMCHRYTLRRVSCVPRRYILLFFHRWRPIDVFLIS